MTKRTFDTSEQFENVCPGDLKLILMNGLPRCGKSSWARDQGFPVVDQDGIRLATTGRRWWGPIEPQIYATAWTMVRALFWAGHEVVVLDSTAINRPQRDLWIARGDVPWVRYVKIIDTSLEICIERAKLTYPALVPVINWMDKNRTPIEDDEGITEWVSS